MFILELGLLAARFVVNYFLESVILEHMKKSIPENQIHWETKMFWFQVCNTFMIVQNFDKINIVEGLSIFLFDPCHFTGAVYHSTSICKKLYLLEKFTNSSLFIENVFKQDMFQ